jgi:hypothetical protein
VYFGWEAKKNGSPQFSTFVNNWNMLRNNKCYKVVPHWITRKKGEEPNWLLQFGADAAQKSKTNKCMAFFFFGHTANADEAALFNFFPGPGSSTFPGPLVSISGCYNQYFYDKIDRRLILPGSNISPTGAMDLIAINQFNENFRAIEARLANLCKKCNGKQVEIHVYFTEQRFALNGAFASAMKPLPRPEIYGFPNWDPPPIPPNIGTFGL